MIMAVVFAIVATIAVILLVLTLSSGEKKIKHEIQTLYAVEDPQFLRSMGSPAGSSLGQTSHPAREGRRAHGGAVPFAPVGSR